MRNGGIMFKPQQFNWLGGSPFIKIAAAMASFCGPASRWSSPLIFSSNKAVGCVSFRVGCDFPLRRGRREVLMPGNGP